MMDGVDPDRPAGRLPSKFLLLVHENRDRDVRRIGKGTKAYNRVHPTYPFGGGPGLGRFPIEFRKNPVLEVTLGVKNHG